MSSSLLLFSTLFSGVFILVSSFMFHWGSYLNSLLTLEGFMLLTYWFLVSMNTVASVGFVLVLLFIVILICAGTYGLCLLVFYSRSGTKDRFSVNFI